MSDNQEEFLERLRDDLSGLRDALDTADWDSVSAIAEGLRADCPGSGWPLVGKLACDLCALLALDKGDGAPADAIEVLVNAVGMAVATDIRDEENMDEELRAGLDLLRKRFEF